MVATSSGSLNSALDGDTELDMACRAPPKALICHLALRRTLWTLWAYNLGVVNLQFTVGSGQLTIAVFIFLWKHILELDSLEQSHPELLQELMDGNQHFHLISISGSHKT